MANRIMEPGDFAAEVAALVQTAFNNGTDEDKDAFVRLFGGIGKGESHDHQRGSESRTVEKDGG